MDGGGRACIRVFRVMYLPGPRRVVTAAGNWYVIARGAWQRYLEVVLALDS